MHYYSSSTRYLHSKYITNKYSDIITMEENVIDTYIYIYIYFPTLLCGLAFCPSHSRDLLTIMHLKTFNNDEVSSMKL